MKKEYKQNNFESNEYIRSTQVSVRFSNTNRKDDLYEFIDEYRNVVKIFVEILWETKKVDSLISKEITSQVVSQTWLSARAIQSAAKQASGIVRGTKQKQKQRLAQINKFEKQKMFKKARKLKEIYKKSTINKPNIDNVCPELDSRFVNTDMANQTSFDGWVSLTSLGNKMKILLPFKKTKHFNKMLTRGKLKSGIRISKRSVTFNFSIIPVEQKIHGEIVGLDKGIKNVYTLSNGESSIPDIHGHTFDSIIQKMNRKKKGSIAFKKCQDHRKNYINWSLNQIDFCNIKTLIVENIKLMRYKKRTNNYLSRFTYTDINVKLDSLSLETGVQIRKINPTYTSQRCSKCGWTRKTNRKGKRFVCGACGNACDADLNASMNISFDLPEISKAERLKHKNKNGFYWNVLGKEPIVPCVQEAI